MIESAEEFKRLRTSKHLDDQRRAGIEEASITTWREIIIRYPELKEWVVYNKTIPLEILKELAKDSDPKIRGEVARKRKIDSEIFDHLKNDQDDGVKLSLFYNPKLTKGQKMQIDLAGSLWLQRQVFQKMKTASSIKKEIELFGYNKFWVELGIVDDQKIKEDLLQFKEGEDSDPDHFRHRRLIGWLKNKTSTNVKEIEVLIHLIKSDIDGSYANTIAVAFYSSDFCKEEHRKYMASKINSISDFLNDFVVNEVIKRKILNNGLSLNELKNIILEEKNSLLRYLVDHTTNHEFLELLSKYTGSKKIRNLARQKIKD